jgi:hypothetical protein
MKKIIVTIVLILVSNVFFAQSVFDKFEGQDNISSIIVNKKMFQMMSSVKVDVNDKETQQYLNLLKKLDNLKVFSTTNVKAATEMKSTADMYWQGAGLSELVSKTENGQSFRIWAKTGATEGQIKELLMFNEGLNNDNQTVLMSLTGDFNLNEISFLIDKMKIPGGNDLKKVATVK